MNLLTINALPPDERVHALYLGYRDGLHGFEVTDLGTVAVPQNLMVRPGNLCRIMKGEDLNLKRDSDEGNVVVWRVQ